MASNWALELNGDEDEDAALRRAIAMSLGEDVSNQPNEMLVSSAQDQAEPEPEPEPERVSSMSALGLDRKKMEEDRLARLKKRKAESISNDTKTTTYHALESQARRPKLADHLPNHLSAAAHSPTSSASQGNQGASEEKPKPSSASHLPYAKGTVLRTHVRGQPRDRDVTIDEILRKDDLELAVLSSFQWDEDWLMTKLNLRKTKVMMIAFAADEATVR